MLIMRLLFLATFAIAIMQLALLEASEYTYYEDLKAGLEDHRPPAQKEWRARQWTVKEISKLKSSAPSRNRFELDTVYVVERKELDWVEMILLRPEGKAQNSYTPVSSHSSSLQKGLYYILRTGVNKEIQRMLGMEGIVFAWAIKVYTELKLPIESYIKEQMRAMLAQLREYEEYKRYQEADRRGELAVHDYRRDVMSGAHRGPMLNLPLPPTVNAIQVFYTWLGESRQKSLDVMYKPRSGGKRLDQVQVSEFTSNPSPPSSPNSGSDDDYGTPAAAATANWPPQSANNNTNDDINYDDYYGNKFDGAAPTQRDDYNEMDDDAPVPEPNQPTTEKGVTEGFPSPPSSSPSNSPKEESYQSLGIYAAPLDSEWTEATRRVYLEELAYLQHGDPTGYDTWTHGEYSKEVARASHPPWANVLLAKVRDLESGSYKVYDAHSAAIDELNHKLKSVDLGRRMTLVAAYENFAEQRAAINACKDYLLEEVFSPGGLAYFLRFHSFVADGEVSTRSPFKRLADVYFVAKLQSPYLDQDMNERIVKWNDDNRKKEHGGDGAEGVELVTIGGGTIGRYSALLAIKAGFNVFLVERYHSSEGEFARKRNVKLDSIWRELLNLYLGTIFDENAAPRPDGDWPVITVIEEPGWLLFIDLFHIERMLGERMRALQRYLRTHRPDIKLEIKEGADAVRMELGDRVEERKKLANYGHVVIEVWNSKQAKERQEKPKVIRKKARVVINAGGASNNRWRDLYHGVTVPQTQPKSYFVVVAERGRRARALSFTHPHRFYIGLNANHRGSYALPLLGDLFAEPDPLFVADEMDSIITSYAGSCIAVATMEESLSKLGTAISELRDSAQLQRYIIAVFNKHDGVQVIGEPPPPLAAFNTHLKGEMERLGMERGSPCYKMGKQVNYYFHAAVIKSVAKRGFQQGTLTVGPHQHDFINTDRWGVVSKGKGNLSEEYVVFFDPESSLNAQIFDMVQSKLRKLAHSYGNLIFNVNGDGGVDPLFVTMSGLATSHRGTEFGIEELRKSYPSSGEKLNPVLAEAIAEDQMSAMVPAREATIQRAAPYLIPVESEAAKLGLATQRLCAFVDQVSREPGKRVRWDEAAGKCLPEVPMARYDDFAIECLPHARRPCVEPSHRDFKVHLHGGDVVKARVTQDAQIFIELPFRSGGAKGTHTQQQQQNGPEEWREHDALGMAVAYVANPIPVY